MKIGLRAMALMLFMAFALSCTKTEDPVVQDNSLNGHEYVDLGLPSGLLWATCNVGAEVPEDIGGYFAWGDTATKEHYDWKSYRYGNSFDGRFEMTKYCTVSDWGLDGFVDDLTILEPSDDVATVCWGEGWRMPTKEDYEELTQNATFVWTVQNGVGGRLFTGPNGNSVFFPVTGFFLDEQVICPGLGIYWSSTLHSGFPERGWSLHFDDVNYHVCGTYERCRGQVVRAVCCRQ